MNDNQISFTLIRHFYKTNSEDNDEDFREMQENKTGKWRRVPIKVCLLALHPIPNVMFTFAPLGVV